MTDRENNLIVGDICKLELLQARWPEIQSRAGIDVELDQKSGSQNRNQTRIHWSPDMNACIRQLYQSDVERFGHN